jgi:hypothetical protein
MRKRPTVRGGRLAHELEPFYLVLLVQPIRANKESPRLDSKHPFELVSIGADG